MKGVIKILLKILIILILITMILTFFGSCVSCNGCNESGFKAPWSGLFEGNGFLSWLKNPFSIFGKKEESDEGQEDSDKKDDEKPGDNTGDNTGEGDKQEGYTVTFLTASETVATVTVAKNTVIGNKMPAAPELNKLVSEEGCPEEFLGFYENETKITADTVVTANITATAKTVTKPHEYAVYKTEKDVQGHFVHYRHCENCGYEEAFSRTVHVIELDPSAENSTDEEGHKSKSYRCTLCDFTASTYDHEYEAVADSETTDAYGHKVSAYECLVCGEIKEIVTHEWKADGTCQKCGEVNMALIKSSSTGGDNPNPPEYHVCQSVCEICGKCKNASCTESVCAEKCTCGGTGGDNPNPSEHVCQSACETCGKCTNASCTEAVCAEKCDCDNTGGANGDDVGGNGSGAAGMDINNDVFIVDTYAVATTAQRDYYFIFVMDTPFDFKRDFAYDFTRESTTLSFWISCSVDTSFLGENYGILPVKCSTNGTLSYSIDSNESGNFLVTGSVEYIGANNLGSTDCALITLTMGFLNVESRFEAENLDNPDDTADVLVKTEMHYRKRNDVIYTPISVRAKAGYLIKSIRLEGNVYADDVEDFTATTESSHMFFYDCNSPIGGQGELVEWRTIYTYTLTQSKRGAAVYVPYLGFEREWKIVVTVCEDSLLDGDNVTEYVNFQSDSVLDLPGGDGSAVESGALTYAAYYAEVRDELTLVFESFGGATVRALEFRDGNGNALEIEIKQSDFTPYSDSVRVVIKGSSLCTALGCSSIEECLETGFIYLVIA